MQLLIIGGTRFLGRHLVESALARGHSVTLFNRGQSNPGLYAQTAGVETINGDREKDLDKLAGRHWDTVIDTCGYLPRVVGLSARALADQVRRYVFISSLSVYAETGRIGIDEQDPVGKLVDGNLEEVTGESYGPLKALCEKAVQNIFAGRALIIRPGLIVGPYDPTDRFTYWPVRVARGGEVLAPEGPQVPVQIIDVRDLAEFILILAERQAGEIYNVTGPDYVLTLGTLLETCKQVSGSDANFNWGSVEFLAKNKLEPWSDLPVWVPDTPEDAGFSRVNISKALRMGLTFQTLENTVRDTLAWAQTRPQEYELRAGLEAEREAQVLAVLRKS